MTSFMTTPVEKTFIDSMVELIIKRRKPLPATGGRKMDQARVDGEHYGLLAGLREALCFYGNERRAQAWPPFVRPEDLEKQWIPGCNMSDVSQWTRDIIKLWDEKADELTDAEYMAKARQKFLDGVVFTPDIRDMMFHQHKSNVLAGLEEPTADDVAWIEEEREVYASMAKPYDELLAKAERRKARREAAESAGDEAPAKGYLERSPR